MSSTMKAIAALALIDALHVALCDHENNASVAVTQYQLSCANHPADRAADAKDAFAAYKIMVKVIEEDRKDAELAQVVRLIVVLY